MFELFQDFTDILFNFVYFTGQYIDIIFYFQSSYNLSFCFVYVYIKRKWFSVCAFQSNFSISKVLLFYYVTVSTRLMMSLVATISQATAKFKSFDNRNILFQAGKLTSIFFLLLESSYALLGTLSLSLSCGLPMYIIFLDNFPHHLVEVEYYSTGDNWLRLESVHG